MNLNNTQFTFEGRHKRNLLIGMALGLVCLIASFFGDDAYHTRFWTNFLHNSVYFTGIAFMAIFFLAAQITAFAGWMSAIKRVWESMGQFMLIGVGLIAVMVIAVWGHFTHLYHWNVPGITDPNNPLFDKIIAGKSGFLNPVFFTIGTLGFLTLWYFMYRGIRRTSVEQDTHETPAFDYYKRGRKWAAAFLPIAGFLSPAFLWFLLMSIDTHWYSTMFAWYSTISLLLGAIAMTVMLILWLKSKGYMEYVSRDHLHDVGKYLFGISVFWMYLWFDQFMLIWYSNIGEETIYFKERMNHYPVLFWGNIVLNFVVPFFILMRNDTKRKAGTMFVVAALVFFGHWMDFFYMIKPGARIAAQEMMLHEKGAHGAHDAAPINETHNGDSHTAPNDATGHSTHGPADDANHESAPQDHSPTNGGMNEDHGAESNAQHMAGHEQSGSDNTHSEKTVAEQKESQAGDYFANPSGTDGPQTINSLDVQTADAGGEMGHDEHEIDKSFKAGFTLPGFLELGIMIGFLCAFLFVFFSSLASASMLPLKDPYLEESLHHTTGAHIDSEIEEMRQAGGHAHH